MLTTPDTAEAPSLLQLEPVADLWLIHGLPFAQGVRYGQIIITGPPGAGKSTFVQALGGWPEEGYINLALPGWWRARALALRPREVNLGLPFRGRPEALTLFDDDWMDDWQTLELDPSRILVPPPKRHLLGVDWRGRFAFEFLLPPPAAVVRYRSERAVRGTHHIDRCIDPNLVCRQVEILAQVARHLHRQGLTVHCRTGVHSPPARILDNPDEHGRA